MNLAIRKLKAACKGRLKKDVAAEAGVPSSFLVMVLHDRKRPGPKILRYLGLEAYVGYRAVKKPKTPAGL